MPTTHVVKQGECFLLIARRHGFADFKRLYEHPDNAELRQKRPNPNVLYPGDTVVIPDKGTPKQKPNLVTGRSHTFTVKAPGRYLRFALTDAEGAPLSGRSYLLTFEQEVIEGNTDDAGCLEEMVPFSVSQVELECEGQCWELELGTLRPMKDTPDDGVSGAEARLINLGYVLEPTGRMTLELRSAIRAFQHQSGLEVTGRLDAETLRKLEELHGS
ncbi:peptidoglycan-binding protein [Myxococcus sp. RHSTA-1-4]|uniref:peptidoglycan-binding protein n=1 Tax=Myxococcus sp. RHSTA-1-4 TaxID=2874601 RepID=UPI001CC183F1|nr:peptidoglycan-binding protein [Myxococcus sp. RHSTA-1-4]MBZ4419189.1 peptidoglycan-binding protein [Myxococcus sp. RHSTA-1-4]